MPKHQLTVAERENFSSCHQLPIAARRALRLAMASAPAQAKARRKPSLEPQPASDDEFFRTTLTRASIAGIAKGDALVTYPWGSLEFSEREVELDWNSCAHFFYSFSIAHLTASFSFPPAGTRVPPTGAVSHRHSARCCGYSC